MAVVLTIIIRLIDHFVFSIMRILLMMLLFAFMAMIRIILMRVRESGVLGSELTMVVVRMNVV